MSSRLNKLLGNVVISQGGVVPHIDPAVRDILPMRKGPRTDMSTASAQQIEEEGRRRVNVTIHTRLSLFPVVLFVLCTCSCSQVNYFDNLIGRMF